ncbi:MAG: hypothetical protein HZB15_02910 [Actinobacteria bacterium]|nr:hypothetical protein [Actinomycetota bacterium]
MGQLVNVIQKPGTLPGVIRFEANRSLTGQGHERFTSPADAVGPRPAAMLARRLLSTGQVEGVHVFSNVITVNLLKGYSGAGLDEIVRELFQYWKPGMEPAVFEAPEAVAEAAPAAASGDGGAATGPEAEDLRLVPPVLVGRSRAAMAKWKASH